MVLEQGTYSYFKNWTMNEEEDVQAKEKHLFDLPEKKMGA